MRAWQQSMHFKRYEVRYEINRRVPNAVLASMHISYHRMLWTAKRKVYLTEAFNRFPGLTFYIIDLATGERVHG